MRLFRHLEGFAAGGVGGFLADGRRRHATADVGLQRQQVGLIGLVFAGDAAGLLETDVVPALVGASSDSGRNGRNPTSLSEALCSTPARRDLQFTAMERLLNSIQYCPR